METVISQLLEQFEHGKVTRRQLIQGLTAAALGFEIRPQPLALDRERVVARPDVFFRTRTFLPACLAMNCSVWSRATGSGIWFGGDFIRYELGPSSAPPMP